MLFYKQPLIMPLEKLQLGRQVSVKDMLFQRIKLFSSAEIAMPHLLPLGYKHFSSSDRVQTLI